jgi:hypothetical protein
MTEVAWVALVPILVTMASSILAAAGSRAAARLAGENQKRADALAVVVRDTHTLVNNNMAIQLRLNKVVTRRLADVTRDPQDEQVADEAAGRYDDHMKKQAKVDAREDADAADGKTKGPAR